jgi:hypothetical protein
MTKKYKTSNFRKILSLGLRQYGYTIDKDNIFVLGFNSTKIPISNIDSISYVSRYVKYSKTYFYLIIDNQNNDYFLPYSLLDGVIYQEFFNEIIRINPTIKLSNDLISFLSSELPKKTLRFDFNFNKKDYFKRDSELAQKYPSLDAFIGLTIVFFFPIPFVFGGVGNKLLIDTFGADYDSYRIWAIVISGIAFMVTLTNLFISLVSMYLGHKLTVISLTVTVIGLYIGFKI